MLSLEDQIERLADHAVHAHVEETPIAYLGDRHRRSRFAATMSAVLVAASVVAFLVVGLVRSGNRTPDIVAVTPTSDAPAIGSATSASTTSSTVPATSTTVAASTRPSVWWSGLGQLPAESARIPLPPVGTITLQADDGRPILVRRTSDWLCILDGPSGGGGCSEILAGASSAEMVLGSWSGVSEYFTALPTFRYWLTSDAVTVSFVDINGVSACGVGPRPVPAYPGVTLWTCTSTTSTRPGQARSVYRVDGTDYVAALG